MTSNKTMKDIYSTSFKLNSCLCSKNTDHLFSHYNSKYFHSTYSRCSMASAFCSKQSLYLRFFIYFCSCDAGNLLSLSPNNSRKMFLFYPFILYVSPPSKNPFLYTFCPYANHSISKYIYSQLYCPKNPYIYMHRMMTNTYLYLYPSGHRAMPFPVQNSTYFIP